MILNLAVWFGLHVVFQQVVEHHAWGLRLLVPNWSTLNLASLILTAGALVMMLRFKTGMIPTLTTTATLGMLHVYLIA